MLDSDILEVVIGVSVVYLLLSLLCSTAMEVIAGLFRLRSKDLEEGIRSLLNPPSGEQPADAAAAVQAFEDFYKHPLVRSLTRRTKESWLNSWPVIKTVTSERKPSYVPARTFASVLFDVIAPEDKVAGSRTLAALRARVDALEDGNVKTQLLSLVTPITLAALEARITALPEGDLRNALQTIVATSDRLETKVELLRSEVAKLPPGPLRDDLLALLEPPSLARVRAWVSLLPTDVIQRQLNAVLGPAAVSDLREKIEQIGNADLKRSLQAVLSEAGDDLVKVRKEVETWFDDAMQRVSGWYKRRAQWILMLVAAPIIVALNADSVTLATTFWQDSAVREIAVATATEQVQNDPANLTAEQIRKRLSALNTLGWRDDSPDYQDPREMPTKPLDWLWKLFGFLLTLGAVAMGADFWFSLLKRLVPMRPSGTAATGATTSSQPAAAPAPSGTSP